MSNDLLFVTLRLLKNIWQGINFKVIFHVALSTWKSKNKTKICILFLSFRSWNLTGVERTSGLYSLTICRDKIQSLQKTHLVLNVLIIPVSVHRVDLWCNSENYATGTNVPFLFHSLSDLIFSRINFCWKLKAVMQSSEVVAVCYSVLF